MLNASSGVSYGKLACISLNVCDLGEGRQSNNWGCADSAQVKYCNTGNTTMLTAFGSRRTLLPVAKTLARNDPKRAERRSRLT